MAGIDLGYRSNNDQQVFKIQRKFREDFSVGPDKFSRHCCKLFQVSPMEEVLYKPINFVPA